MPDNRKERTHDWAWYLAIAAISSLWCLLGQPRTGVTYDERFYLRAGLQGWQEWSNCELVSRGTMPLPVEVHTTVLYAWSKLAERGLAPPMANLDKDIDPVLAYARGMNLLFWWLLLWQVQGLGRELGGPWAGRLGLLFTASDPTLLGHAMLATTDLSLAAGCTAFVRSGLVNQDRGLARRVLIPGFWLGFVSLCKASGLLYALLAMAMLEAIALLGPALRRDGTSSVRSLLRSVGRSLGRSILVVLVGLVIVVAYSGFDRDQKAFAPVVERLRKIGGVSEQFAEWGTNQSLPNAVVALSFQHWQNHEGRPAYLLGKLYTVGCWHYYPVLLLLKLPLPSLVLAVAITLTRPRAWVMSIAAIALIWLLVAMPSKVQIGIRLVLPAVTLGYTALAVAVVRGWGDRGRRIGLAVGIVQLLLAFAAWPHGLEYSNGLGDGGPDGIERFSDSNLDWGQGLPELRRWQEQHGEPTIAVWYFGQDSQVERAPFRRFDPTPTTISSVEDWKNQIGTNHVAVGATVLTLISPQAKVTTPAKRFVDQWLCEHEPIGRTPTFLIYHLDDSPRRSSPRPQLVLPPRK